MKWNNSWGHRGPSFYTKRNFQMYRLTRKFEAFTMNAVQNLTFYDVKLLLHTTLRGFWLFKLREYNRLRVKNDNPFVGTGLKEPQYFFAIGFALFYNENSNAQSNITCRANAVLKKNPQRFRNTTVIFHWILLLSP